MSNQNRELLERTLSVLTGPGVPGAYIKSLITDIEREIANHNCNFIQREGRCDGYLWDECTTCGSVDKNICKLENPEPDAYLTVDSTGKRHVHLGKMSDSMMKDWNISAQYKLYISPRSQ